jgi:hypothetical protein
MFFYTQLAWKFPVILIVFFFLIAEVFFGQISWVTFQHRSCTLRFSLEFTEFFQENQFGQTYFVWIDLRYSFQHEH